MTFEPENALEQALQRAMTEPAVRPEFYRLLLEANLYIIGQMAEGAPAQAESAGQSGGRLMIATITHQNRQYHPVFTALSRLQNFVQQDVQHLAIAGRTLFEASRGALFLLNPASECGKELSAEEIATLIGPSASQPVRVKIGQPAVYPEALVAALKTLFAQSPEVVGAHLIEIAVEGSDEPPHPMIGVETEGDWQGLSQAMGEVMKTTPLETVVDMLAIDRAEPTGIMQALLQTPPFYKREIKAKPP
jgi:hypothetical protein